MRIWGEEKLVVSLLLWGMDGKGFSLSYRQGAAQALPLAFDPHYWFVLADAEWQLGRNQGK